MYDHELAQIGRAELCVKRARNSLCDACETYIRRNGGGLDRDDAAHTLTAITDALTELDAAVVDLSGLVDFGMTARGVRPR